MDAIAGAPGDRSLASVEVQENPYEYYDVLREQAPVYYDPGLDLWLVTRYADCVTVLQDDETYSLEHGYQDRYGGENLAEFAAILERDGGGFIRDLAIDPPAHTRLRRLTEKAFTAHRVKDLEPRMRQIIVDLIEGVADNEDVDFYAVEARKGMRLTAEVEGLRLNGNFWDPYVAIMDSKRFELAAADDTALLAQDSFAQIIVPEDGVYIVQVRDSSYVGNGGCRYRLQIGSFPRPSAVYPAGGKAGTALAVTYVGEVGGPIEQQVTLPTAESSKWGVLATVEGVSAPSPNWMRVSAFDNVLEVEPNGDFPQATAARGPLPLAFNGVIGAPGDVDRFRFSVKKDQKFTFSAHARSIRSPLDPVMQIFKASDQSLIIGNDDATGMDAKLEFTAPEDGEYILCIFDHLRAGGVDYV